MNRAKYILNSLFEKINIKKLVAGLSAIVIIIVIILLIVLLSSKNRFELNTEKIIIDVNTSKTIYTTLKNKENQKVVWTTLNEMVAKVDENGKVTGVSAGTAVVEAKYDNEILKCEVIVLQMSSELKMINKVELDLNNNNRYKLEVSMNLTMVTDESEFKSLNENIVQVLPDGTLIAKAVGSTTVIATFNEMSTVCEVTVINSDDKTQNKGDNTKVTSDKTGNSTADKNNTTTNSGNRPGESSSTTIKTSEKTTTTIGVTKLTLAETMIYLKEGSSRKLTLTIYPKTLKDEKIVWTSSNKQVAIVNGEGQVSAVKEGTAIITAMASNGKKTTCVVSVIKKSKPKTSPIVEIALAEVGNKGGEKYWDWYLGWKTAWCAIFVSWVTNEVGYIEKGIAPKFLSCRKGVEWFKAQGKWKNRDYVAKPGDIIFFDYNHDGVTNHVGIVEKVEGNVVYTIEGNYDDEVKQSHYNRDDLYVLGYGVISE